MPSRSPARLAVLALLSAFALSGWGSPAVAAVLRHDLQVTLDPAARWLKVVDMLQLSGGTRTLRLAAGLVVSEATIAGRPLPVERRGESLRLTMPDGGGTITLRYAGSLPPIDATGRSTGAMAGGAMAGAMAGPEGAFLPAGSGWMPSEGDEPPPSWALTVRVPGPFVAVATGRLTVETVVGTDYSASFVEDRAVEEPSLFAGPWEIKERRHDGLWLRTYFPKDQAELSDRYLDVAAATIDAQTRRIGPYPFAGFSILSVPLPVGLGFPGLTCIGKAILPLPFIAARSLPHEITHNWWGNGVRVGEGGNWAEGLTTFMADYAAAEAKGPQEARAMRLDWLRDYAALPADRDMALSAFQGKTHDASQVVGYGKAAMVFHMLRDLIGAPAFDAGIRQFWERNRFKAAGWADLRRAFEATSGRDLGGFFAQWIDRPGAPTLQLAAAKADGNSVAVTLRQEAPVYAMTVPVTVDTAAGTEPGTVRLEDREGSALLMTKAAPSAVAVDPDFDLFRQLAEGEAPPILRDVTLDPKADVVVAGEGPAADAAAELARRLIDGKPDMVAADKVDATSPLLVIGAADGVAVLLDRLGLPKAPETLAGRGTARVWAARGAEGRPILVVEGTDAAALEALLRPLPHYGRQSWLVFDGATAIDRGVWPVEGSALRRPVD